ncbi:hypothetical protein PYCCODRAFT_157736 [Trametes coccinea BRFM310]|uniref:Uncharacterized protein n=1 Tax=Trametes coccinea (strain BRFM310) TaxID=1353009 RepID=A0A1Y2IS03_TRAC3|nr:hypothetical protein PYCCODRAFT_157736 [Trametes coccinea BRFM310]
MMYLLEKSRSTNSIMRSTSSIYTSLTGCHTTSYYLRRRPASDHSPMHGIGHHASCIKFRRLPMARSQVPDPERHVSAFRREVWGPARPSILSVRRGEVGPEPWRHVLTTY